MFVIGFFFRMFSVRVYAQNLFIKSDMLIWILLYNNLFKCATFLLYMYQNHIKYNTRTMNISENQCNNEYDMLLHNPEWKILPTIDFLDGYPRILTRKDHDGGCNFIHIYFCRWRNNIPSPVSNQICHAVVKPRTVKHMKVGYNSTGYQMAEQRSSWKVPDTINVSSVVNTDHVYILIKESEARSYANHTDTKSLIQRLIDDEKMSNNHAEGKEDFSKCFQETLTTSNKNLYDFLFPLKLQFP